MEQFVDVEIALRNYLRTQDLGAGVFMGIPDSPSFPLITISQISESNDVNIPIEYPRLSLDLWGTHKAQVSALKARLKSVLFATTNKNIVPEVHVYWIRVDNVVWRPDYSNLENKLSRYVVDITVMLRSNSLTP